MGTKYIIINRSRFGLDKKYMNFLQKVYRYTEKKIWFGLRTKETMTRVDLWEENSLNTSEFFESLVIQNYDDVYHGRVKSHSDERYMPVPVIEEKEMCGRTFYRVTYLNYWLDKDDVIELTDEQVLVQYSRAISKNGKVYMGSQLTVDMIASLVERNLMHLLKVDISQFRFDIWRRMNMSFLKSIPHFIECKEVKDHPYNPLRNHIVLTVYCERPGIFIGKGGFDIDLWRIHIQQSLKELFDDYLIDFHIQLKEYNPFKIANRYPDNEEYNNSELIF